MTWALACDVSARHPQGMLGRGQAPESLSQAAADGGSLSVDMGLNVKEGSLRRKKKHTSGEQTPSDPNDVLKEGADGEISEVPQSEVLQEPTNNRQVEFVEAGGENALEPIAPKRRLLSRKKPHKHIIKKKIEHDPGSHSPGGDPALPNHPDSRPSSTGPSDESDSDDSGSTTGSSTETSCSDSDEDSEDDGDSDSSVSSTEKPPAPPDPGQTSPDNPIQKGLSGMSFEELLQLQNKVGTKLYNQMLYGAKTGPSAMENTKKKPRLNKNRPMEISAKKPAPFLRQVVPVKKKVHRDPRFDDLSGEYKPEIFEKTYSFINDIKSKEKKDIEKKLKKVKDPEQKQKLEQLLQRLAHQEKAQQARQRQREKELEFKKNQRELAKQGKKPFFLKKSEKRTLGLADKYMELKKSGKLENFLSKKRKRNAGKDKRRLPTQKSW
ncbi:ribosomal RNA processing protein 36 homolog [Pleurodeles waltl]|uniref:ribosomal RNA processing protein 36 homolog n=1 Tax=Pleurodeles waltl TaxID=8319 RepID=UPI003709B268